MKGQNELVENAPPRAQTKALSKGRVPRRSRWRIPLIIALFVGLLLVAARLAMPGSLRWYVNRTLNQSPMYQGEIGEVRVHLWRGAYSIHNVRILKRTGNVPVPLFASDQLDLALQWDALLHGKLVGRIAMERPALNFVDAGDESRSQSGVGGPWLPMIRDLFPFKINRALIHDGAIHFRAVDREPAVDVYLSKVEASIENLTNVRDELSPMFASVTAQALAMDQAKFEYEMRFDLFSYHPTFQLAVRLLGLDVTKLNDLADAYGQFDFERGWFDLVLELNSREGQLEGYIKPLFRDIAILRLRKDMAEENVFKLFWEALVGATTFVFQNQPRDQFGTVIPVRGSLTSPQTDLPATLANLLRNAFIRAYLPRLEGITPDIEGLEFGPGESVTEPLPGGAPL